MPINEQTLVDLGTHELRITTEDGHASLDLFTKADGDDERIVVSANVNQLGAIIEKLGRAVGNLTAP